MNQLIIMDYFFQYTVHSKPKKNCCCQSAAVCLLLGSGLTKILSTQVIVHFLGMMGIVDYND